MASRNSSVGGIEGQILATIILNGKNFVRDGREEAPGHFLRQGPHHDATGVLAG